MWPLHRRPRQHCGWPAAVPAGAAAAVQRLRPADDGWGDAQLPQRNGAAYWMDGCASTSRVSPTCSSRTDAYLFHACTALPQLPLWHFGAGMGAWGAMLRQQRTHEITRVESVCCVAPHISAQPTGRPCRPASATADVVPAGLGWAGLAAGSHPPPPIRRTGIRSSSSRVRVAEEARP